jgi:hypothetical protein
MCLCRTCSTAPPNALLIAFSTNGIRLRAAVARLSKGCTNLSASSFGHVTCVYQPQTWSVFSYCSGHTGRNATVSSAIQAAMDRMPLCDVCITSHSECTLQKSKRKQTFPESCVGIFMPVASTLYLSRGGGGVEDIDAWH